MGYIGIVQHKEHSPEVLSFPPGTPCIHTYIYISDRTDRLLDTLNAVYMRFVHINCLTKHDNPLGPYNSVLSTKIELRNYFVAKLAALMFGS